MGEDVVLTKYTIVHCTVQLLKKQNDSAIRSLLVGFNLHDAGPLGRTDWVSECYARFIFEPLRS